MVCCRGRSERGVRGDGRPSLLAPELDRLAELVEREVGHDLMAVEVEHPQVFLGLEVLDDVGVGMGVAHPDRLELDLVGDELVDALVAQLADQPFVGDSGIGRQHQDGRGAGELAEEGACGGEWSGRGPAWRSRRSPWSWSGRARRATSGPPPGRWPTWASPG